MLAEVEGKTSLRIFALDRIHEVRMTQKAFALPKDFSPAEYFRGYFGTVRDNEQAVQTIRLKVWGDQRDYFKALPLNETMHEVETYDEWSIFELEMAHTCEVEMELLQYNDMVEVLEPASLRDMMIEHAWNMLKLYNEV